MIKKEKKALKLALLEFVISIPPVQSNAKIEKPKARSVSRNAMTDTKIGITGISKNSSVSIILSKKKRENVQSEIGFGKTKTVLVIQLVSQPVQSQDISGTLLLLLVIIKQKLPKETINNYQVQVRTPVRIALW
jgi:hypothetical protein